MTPRRLVSKNEVAEFRRHGFVVVPRPVVPARALGVARTLLDALFARAHELPAAWVHDLSGTPEEGSVPEIVNCAHLAPGLLRTRAYRSAARCARRLLGAPVELSFDHAIFKPPGDGTTTTLHQDLAFVPTWDVVTATIWLALVDVTESNGCMRFLPSTPAGLVEHAPVGRDGLGAAGIELEEATACPVPAGGFTAHSQRAMHGSGPNRSADVRAVWILKFVRDGRSWRRRVWERSLELQGVAVPRRLDELQAAYAPPPAATHADPAWVARPSSPVQDPGSVKLPPSGDQRA